jgi:diamine N-acetyltransferase
MLQLEKINHENLDKVLALEVSAEQKSFVADNARSIIEAYITTSANGHAFPFAVIDDVTPVGFVMIGFAADDEWTDAPEIAKDNYSIWRLMIDKKYQGKGYGKGAMRLALEFVRSFPCGKAQYCWVSYLPENTVAEKLYRSFGFEKTDCFDGGERIAVLKL